MTTPWYTTVTGAAHNARMDGSYLHPAMQRNILKQVVTVYVGSKDSAATNGLPPLQPDRSWSRDLSEAKEPAVASPPVSVKGAASEDGFAASEGQMK